MLGLSGLGAAATLAVLVCALVLLALAVTGLALFFRPVFRSGGATPHRLALRRPPVDDTAPAGDVLAGGMTGGIKSSERDGRRSRRPKGR
jgi:hypothetical protein